MGWMRRGLAVLLLGAGLAGATAGCLQEAPRGNPLDPLSPDFEDVGGLEGRVTTVYPPFGGLAGAEVRLTPGPFLAVTASDGRYAFPGVPSGAYQMRVTRDGYAPVDTAVTVLLGSVVQMDLALPGRPAVTTAALRAVQIHRWFPQEPLQILDVTVAVADPDGVQDVERVWLEVPALGYADTLAGAGGPGQFAGTIVGAELPASLQALQGQAMHLGVRDRSGVVVVVDAPPLVRVIDFVPVAVSPQGLEPVSGPPFELAWEPVVLPYSFTFRLDVVRVEADIQTPVVSIPDLSAELNTYTLTTALDPGDYFWTVSVVDAFGNRSRSREAGFQVVE
ncbi:hypothetical protein AWN76_000235 [Rhodothermaceae bacterium RA]|nr:hypothetical protein AWN76_000235 [Rhodothermaceae bacterium RA]